MVRAIRASLDMGAPESQCVEASFRMPATSASASAGSVVMVDACVHKEMHGAHATKLAAFFDRAPETSTVAAFPFEPLNDAWGSSKIPSASTTGWPPGRGGTINVLKVLFGSD